MANRKKLQIAMNQATCKIVFHIKFVSNEISRGKLQGISLASEADSHAAK